MLFTFRNRQVVIGRKQILYAFVLAVAWLTLVSSRFDPLEAIFLLGIIYLALRITTKPLSHVIARSGYSIRWKFEIGIAVIAGLSLIVSLIQIGAMNYMHDELHMIQDLSPEGSLEILGALNALEDTHHGLLYRLLPFLGILGVLGSAAVGAAMARSVIDPVRKMEGAMDRIASGDFSQPVYVDNNDELGELARRINDSAIDLARLQEATLAEERARALQQRIIQVTTAQEEERRRISRDLHDGLGPSLAAIGNRLRVCQRMVHTDPQRADRELEEMATGLKGHVQEVRELIHDLRPLTLDQLGLAGAVRQQAEGFDQETGIQANVSISGNIVLDPFAEVTVYRVVQECLSNVRKHSEASQVEVRLQAAGDRLEVGVKDNGRGFDPSHVAAGKGGNGMGLLSMQERAELLGGSVRVHSTPQGGCEIILDIPSREVEFGAHSNPAGG